MNWLVQKIVDIHLNLYACRPSVIAYAPGRVEILGNHTDYNAGTVLSAAINMGIYFAISPSNEVGIRLHAANYEASTKFDISQPAGTCEFDWANYVHGVFYYIASRGYEVDAWNCSFYGDLPIGAGLSSSAALEISASYAARSMLDANLTNIELAKIAQKSEHEFVGSMTGLMDQFSSIFAQEYHVVHSDFRNEEVFTVKLPIDIRFLLVTPKIRHSHISSPYNERRRSCEQAAFKLARLMKASHPKEFTLRDIDVRTFLSFKDALPLELAKRASHVITEINRVEQGIACLEEGDLQTFGELMFQSHESSRFDFENSIPELDFLVNTAKKAGVFGARLSGGGWGGSVITMVAEDHIQTIEKVIGDSCKYEELDIEFCLTMPSGGATLVQLPNSN